MLGLFGTLDLGTRALQTQRLGVEVAGHNIANVNNPGFSRQRLELTTSVTIKTGLGLQGTGGEGSAIMRLRSVLLDSQIQSETSVSSYFEAQQLALQFAQTSLGQTIQSQGGTKVNDAGQYGIGDGMGNLFGAFQSLSNDPSSASERQALLMKATELTTRFNLVTSRLDSLQGQLNATVQEDVTLANSLMAEIAVLNDQISRAELSFQNGANDLRDVRQSKIEELAKLTSVQVGENPDGTVNLSIAGTTFVSGLNIVEKLQVYDAGGGRSMVRAETTGAPLTFTGGSIAGTIDIRDGEVAGLQQSLDALAATLINEVNTLHQSGFNLSGGTGALFFTGTDARTIGINQALIDNPSLFQASGVGGAAGDNQVALALAQLAEKAIPGFDGRTMTENYAQTVAALGQSLSSINTRIEDQHSVQTLLATQRDAVSGVSLDEEMASIMKFQKAYEASARLISVVGELLDTLLQIQR